MDSSSKGIHRVEATGLSDTQLPARGNHRQSTMQASIPWPNPRVSVSLSARGCACELLKLPFGWWGVGGL